jgi:hypothetical protein
MIGLTVDNQMIGGEDMLIGIGIMEEQIEFLENQTPIKEQYAVIINTI